MDAAADSKFGARTHVCVTKDGEAVGQENRGLC